MLGLCNLTMTITTQPWVKQTDGSIKVSGSSTGSAIPCALQANSSAEALEYKRETGRQMLSLYYPYSYGGSAVSLSHEQLVNVGGTQYKVIGKPRDMGGRQRFVKADVELVQ